MGNVQTAVTGVVKEVAAEIVTKHVKEIVMVHVLHNVYLGVNILVELCVRGVLMAIKVE